MSALTANRLACEGGLDGLLHRSRGCVRGTLLQTWETGEGGHNRVALLNQAQQAALLGKLVLATLAQPPAQKTGVFVAHCAP